MDPAHVGVRRRRSRGRGSVAAHGSLADNVSIPPDSGAHGDAGDRAWRLAAERGSWTPPSRSWHWPASGGPRLLVARRVLEQMPGDELQVIVKHELAHARQRDNVARLLLSALPDVLGLGHQWLGIERAWHEAAEDAADELATGDDAQARVCLASALVRVARMVGSGRSGGSVAGVSPRRLGRAPCPPAPRGRGTATHRTVAPARSS